MKHDDTKKLFEEMFRTEKHDGVMYDVNRTFESVERERPDGSIQNGTLFHDACKVSYAYPYARTDIINKDDTNTLNFCFVKRERDIVEISSYPRVQYIHLNYESLKNARFWCDKQYDLIIHNDHQKKFISILNLINSALNSNYVNYLQYFLRRNSEHIKSIEFTNISPLTLSILKKVCRGYGVKVIDKKKTALNTEVLKKNPQQQNEDKPKDPLLSL